MCVCYKGSDQDQLRKSGDILFFHYKPMGIFLDIQGKLNPQWVVQLGQNSNSSELSCMSSLPASMKRNG